jgi:hypothetical protein
MIMRVFSAKKCLTRANASPTIAPCSRCLAVAADGEHARAWRLSASEIVRVLETDLRRHVPQHTPVEPPSGSDPLYEVLDEDQ